MDVSGSKLTPDEIRQKPAATAWPQVQIGTTPTIVTMWSHASTSPASTPDSRAHACLAHSRPLGRQRTTGNLPLQKMGDLRRRDETDDAWVVVGRSGSLLSSTPRPTRSGLIGYRSMSHSTRGQALGMASFRARLLLSAGCHRWSGGGNIAYAPNACRWQGTSTGGQHGGIAQGLSRPHSAPRHGPGMLTHCNLTPRARKPHSRDHGLMLWDTSPMPLIAPQITPQDLAGPRSASALLQGSGSRRTAHLFRSHLAHLRDPSVLRHSTARCDGFYFTREEA